MKYAIEVNSGESWCWSCRQQIADGAMRARELPVDGCGKLFCNVCYGKMVDKKNAEIAEWNKNLIADVKRKNEALIASGSTQRWFVRKR